MVAHILGLARTPFVPIFGALAEESSVALGTAALNGVLNMGFSLRDRVDKVLLSQVFTSGTGPSPSKQIAAASGLKNASSCFQTSNLCISGLKAVTLAYDVLHVGRAQLVAAVGVESVSQAPYLLKKARMGGYGVGDGVLVDTITCDGFSRLNMDVDAFLDVAKISKMDMMQYAADMFRRTAACYSDGIMENEVMQLIVNNSKLYSYQGILLWSGTPSKVGSGKWISQTQVKVQSDTLYKIFVPNEASTNNIKTKSTMADGAASLIMSGDNAQKESGVPIASIIDYVELSAGASDTPYTLVSAIKELRHRIRRNVDIYDILDQYAFLPLFVSKELNIDPSRINVNGSTLSIGHPMGASGLRQIITMVTALRSRGLRFGCVAGVNMSGDAIAILVECH